MMGLPKYWNAYSLRGHRSTEETKHRHRQNQVEEDPEKEKMNHDLQSALERIDEDRSLCMWFSDFAFFQFIEDRLVVYPMAGPHPHSATIRSRWISQDWKIGTPDDWYKQKEEGQKQ